MVIKLYATIFLKWPSD